MSKFEFDIDPRNKLGSDEGWAEDGDFNDFVDALNSGAIVRADGIPGVDDPQRENELDAAALLQLRNLFANYR